jgi:hypothetical protein
MTWSFTANGVTYTDDDMKTGGHRSKFPEAINNIFIEAQNLAASGGGFAFIPYTFDASTTMSDPGNGDLRVNHGSNFASVTTFACDDQNDAGTDVQGLLDFFDESTATTKGVLILRHRTNIAIWAAYRLTAVSEQSGYWQLTVTHIDSGGSLASLNTGDDVTLGFIPSYADVSGLGTAAQEDVGTDANEVVQRNGSGQIDANSQHIINGLDPTSDQHLSTKKYVDDEIAAYNENLVLLETDIVSTDAASVVMNSFSSTYDAYWVNGRFVKSDVDGKKLFMRTSNSGSPHDSGASDYDWMNGSNLKGLQNSYSDYDAADDRIVIVGASALTVGSQSGSEGLTFWMYIEEPDLSQHTRFYWEGFVQVSSGFLTAIQGSGRRIEAATVDSIEFFFDTGSSEKIEAGAEFRLYGVKKL